MLASFVALTFALTWALWALVLGAWNGAHEAAQVPPLLALGGPVFLAGVFAPGIVAVVLTAATDGRGGVRALLEPVTRWRVGLRFYAFALLLMPLTKLTVAVLHRVLVGAWPRLGETRPLLLLLATVLSTLGQAGEEIGWRGYLLPRLTTRTGLAAASVLTGAIWATWHLPLFFARGADTNGQSFPLYAVQVTSYSVALAWLYWRTGGSLLLTMFMHAAFNNLKDIVPSAAEQGASPFTLHGSAVFRLTIAVLSVVAVVLLVRMRGVRGIGDRDGEAPVRPAA